MQLLVEVGGDALSMRKIAEKAQMSLSNLQYYFKTKDVLLAELMGYFLADYVEGFRTYKSDFHDDPRAKLKRLLSAILERNQTSDCDKIFKELWLTASRNQHVKAALDRYYQELSLAITEVLLEMNPTWQQSNVTKAAYFLISLLEGCCITRATSPLTTAELTEQATRAMHVFLDQGKISITET